MQMTTLKIYVTTLTFIQAAKAIGHGMANISSSHDEEYRKFLDKKNLTGKPIILMATHSIGVRDWKALPKSKQYFFEEKSLGGGWHIFTEENVEYCSCDSHTSGSSIEIRKELDGTWTAILEVPVQDGTVYRGVYWRTFHDALGIQEEVPAELTA